MYVIPLILILWAAAQDLKSRTIPDWIAGAILLWALAGAACGVPGTTWFGLISGLALGLALGATVFALGGIGGGDVKLIAALGAVLGPAALMGMLFWMAVAGGLLALVARWRGLQDLAYVPAIAAGLLIHSIRAGEWTNVLH